jgi:glycosyltransferase XagB
VALHEFGKQYELPVRLIHYVKLIAGSPFYQLILMGAALRAVWRESTGRNDWELTRHVGAHLSPPGTSARPITEGGIA